MYTAIRQYTMPDPSAVEEVARRATEGFVPLIRQAPGFVTWYLVHREHEVQMSNSEGNIVAPDPAAVVLLSVSVFETQAQAHASTMLAANWIKENLAEFLPDPPTVTGGEIVVHAWPGEATPRAAGG